jgi:hypothetical protein
MNSAIVVSAKSLTDTMAAELIHFDMTEIRCPHCGPLVMPDVPTPSRSA